MFQRISNFDANSTIVSAPYNDGKYQARAISLAYFTHAHSYNVEKSLLVYKLYYGSSERGFSS